MADAGDNLRQGRQQVVQGRLLQPRLHGHQDPVEALVGIVEESESLRGLAGLVDLQGVMDDLCKIQPNRQHPRKTVVEMRGPVHDAPEVGDHGVVDQLAVLKLLLPVQFLDLLVHRRGVVAIEDVIAVSGSAHQVSLAPVVAVMAEETLPPSSEEEGVALAGRGSGSAAHAGPGVPSPDAPTSFRRPGASGRHTTTVKIQTK